MEDSVQDDSVIEAPTTKKEDLSNDYGSTDDEEKEEKEEEEGDYKSNKEEDESPNSKDPPSHEEENPNNKDREDKNGKDGKDIKDGKDLSTMTSAIVRSDDKPKKKNMNLIGKKLPLKIRFKENEELVRTAFSTRDIIRGPRSAWLYFLHANKEGSEPYSSLCKRLSAKWKALTPEEKFIFLEKEKKDRKRFENDKKRLNSTDHRILKEIKSQKRKMSKKNCPPRPRSGYGLFLMEQCSIIKQEHPELSHTGRFKEVAKRWNELDVNVKSKYLDIAAKESVLYQKRKKARLVKFDNPPPRPSSAYTCKNGISARTQSLAW